MEYEGLHLICANCGRYGHVSRNCSNGNLADSLAPGAPPGPPKDMTTANGNTMSVQTDTPVVQTISSGSAMVFTPHVSQGVAGAVYDLENQMHGDWMTVTRKKKVAPKNPFDGLKTSIQQTNTAMASNPNSGGSKLGSKPKRRKQDSSQQTPLA